MQPKWRTLRCRNRIANGKIFRCVHHFALMHIILSESPIVQRRRHERRVATSSRHRVQVRRPAHSAAGNQLAVRVSRTQLPTQRQGAHPAANSHVGQIKYDQPSHAGSDRGSRNFLRGRVLPCRGTRDRSSLLQIDAEDKSSAANHSN